jgi:hypothetical protein
MIFKSFKNTSKIYLILGLFAISLSGFCQDSTSVKKRSEFWKKVQIGGGLGLNVGGGFTDITVAPSAIYNVNDYVSLGIGIQGSYASVKNDYNSFIYGGSLIGLFNPIEQIQFSIELEQLRVNNTYETIPNSIKNSFWNTGLFIGAGYRTNNVTIGARYNVLYNEKDDVYANAFMPFIRVYF